MAASALCIGTVIARADNASGIRYQVYTVTNQTSVLYNLPKSASILNMYSEFADDMLDLNMKLH